MKRFGRMVRGAAVVILLVAGRGLVRADTLITDFNSATVGSYSPREDWSAFGDGTTDRGIRSEGSVGRGAYHSVAWASSAWGIGDKKDTYLDLSGFSGVRIDARIVDLGGLTGTPLLRLGLNMTDGTEYSSPTVTITGTYQTYAFDFSTLTRTAGSGALNLANCQLKFTVRKNGQSGSARFDFDEVWAFGAVGGPYTLTPVVLNPPPDGDAIRAIWMYSGTKFDSGSESQGVLDFCAREGVNRIYCGAYSVWNLGTTVQKDNLRTFIQTAHASDIRIEALCGDVNWQANPATVRTKIDQILALHNATPGNSLDDFDAVHFDCEFWLDSTWKSAADEAARQDIARDYLDHVLVNARDHLDTNGAAEVDIAVDLSTHFNSSSMLPSPMLYDGVTQYFVEHVLDHVDDVVFMSYYDTTSSLVSTTSNELDWAAGKGRRVQLGADMQPADSANNTFADNAPTPFAAMTTTLQAFHLLLSPTRLAALDGFSVFHYTGYSAAEPAPHNWADLDGDGDADDSDYGLLQTYLLGPGVGAVGVARDGDLDQDGHADLADFARFAQCFTGAGGTGPIPGDCER